MTFSEFMNQAWADHADRPSEVAERLQSSQAHAETSADVIGLAGLLTHIYGEHLGQWAQGVAALEKLQILDSDAAFAIRRSIASLKLSSGDASPLDGLSLSDRVRVLAVSASALTGQKQTERAAEFFNEALATELPDDDPAIRALAITSNNLACALEEKPNRSIQESAFMIRAAIAARKFWQLAGTWIHVERAEYRLANSYLKAGDIERARFHARECLRICELNGADEFEMKYAREIVSQTT